MHDDPFRLEFVFNALCDYSAWRSRTFKSTRERQSKGLSNSKMKSKTAHKRKAEKKARMVTRRSVK